jgi:hypothetical protein
MTRLIVSAVTTIMLVSPVICLAANSTLRQSSAQAATVQAAISKTSDSNAIEPQTPQAAPTVRRPRPRVDTVTMADFYLRDGNTVSGKLLSDDKNQIIIEQPSESTIVIRTFSKREVDTRTLGTRVIPEWRYYTQLGEYFAARTWDFRDDPDDFIQAIRSYEKAKQSLEAGGAEEDKLAEIDKAIQKLKSDKDVWTSQVESRAKLKKLEYEAEAENRLKQLERQVAESNVKLTESIKYLDKTSQDIKDNYQRMEKALGELNKDFVRQIQNLDARVQYNLAAINDIWFYCCRPRPGPTP